MLDQGWQSTNDRIADIRKDIEIDRLKILDEKNELELKEAHLNNESARIEKLKAEHKELFGAQVGLAAGAGEKGLELLIEEEVKRRIKVEDDKKEIEALRAKEEGVDLELKTL